VFGANCRYHEQVRIGVSHLSGADRGRVQTLRGTVLRVGSEAGCELWVRGPGVLRRHATIRIEEAEAYLEPHGPIRLNGHESGEVILHNYDLLEIGRGTKLRIRLLPDKTSLPDRPALPRRRGAWIPALATALVVAVGIALFLIRPDQGSSVAERLENQAIWSVARQRAAERRVATIQRDLHSLEGLVAHRRSDVEARVGEVQRAVAQVESNVLQSVTTEVERTLGRNPDLRAAREAATAAERIIAANSGAVCLIQGAYGFGREKDGRWHFLREADPELIGELDLDDQKVPLMLEGNGPLFRVEFTGTGFLVDSGGIVITNRHIAQPWWKNDAAQPLISDGFEPRFMWMRIYFPGRKQAILCDPAVAVVPEQGDLAALRFEAPRDLPTPLTLAPADAVVIGRRVLMIGYPSGLNALLARAEETFAKDHRGKFEPVEILDALAARGLVRPLPTRGHISDIVGEHKMLFDAPTAVGASGAPIMDMKGRVLGVNYGILKSFSGANFGVPVGAVRRILARAKRGSAAALSRR